MTRALIAAAVLLGGCSQLVLRDALPAVAVAARESCTHEGAAIVAAVEVHALTAEDGKRALDKLSAECGAIESLLRRLAKGVDRDR